MNESVKLVHGGIVVEDYNGRGWVWSNKQINQAVNDSKACGCGECVCCTIARKLRRYVGKSQ